MVDPRRSSPEPPWGGPEIVHTPGVADDLMRELAPILAEDGIDLDDPDSIPDTETLQAALDRAVERRNMELFTPVGEARSLALTTLRLYVEAIASDQTELAGIILATAVPESPDGSQATVAGTIGVALYLLDTILTGSHPDTPAGIGAKARLPAGHWSGERATPRHPRPRPARASPQCAGSAHHQAGKPTPSSQAPRSHWRARCSRGQPSSVSQSTR